MCFKIRFELDWQPIGGIGHLLYSRKGDAKGGCAAAPGIILVPGFRRERAVSGYQGGSRRATRTATARHPYIGQTSALPREVWCVSTL